MERSVEYTVRLVMLEIVWFVFDKSMGGGEVPFSGRVPKPVEERKVRVNPLLDGDSHHFDSRLYLCDFLNHPLIRHSMVALLLVRSLYPNFHHFVQELAGEFSKGTMLVNALESKDGGDMPQQLIRRPLRLEEHMGNIGRTNKNFVERGFRMIRKAGETESLQRGEVDRWRGDRWDGRKAIEESELD